MASNSDSVLSDSDRILIERFAAGDETLRGRAIDAYRRALSAGPGQGPHMRFMAEVDNAMPDLLLRAQYRQALTTRKK